MRPLIYVLTSIVFFVSGLVSASGLSHLEHQITVKFSHEHDHKHNQYDHDEQHKHTEESAEKQTAQSNQESGHHHNSQHTHEITVSCGHFFVAVNSVTLPSYQLIQEQFPNPFDVKAPASCFLDSLFRPPIQA